jgi:quercetin dioxygenase-like cupin family protein
MLSKLIVGVVFACSMGCAAVAQNPTVAEPKHYMLEFQNERVEVVYIHYGPHEKSGIHDHPNGVVVNLTAGHLRFMDQNGKVQEVYGKAGEARWFPPFKHRVENLGDAAYDGIYIGLKEKTTTASEGGNAPSGAEMHRIIAETLIKAMKDNPSR